MIAEVKNAECINQIQNSLMIPENDLVFDVIDAYFKGLGMQAKWATAYRKILVNDWNTCSLPVEKKMWALKHGFLPSSILLYDLDDSNVNKYLSDMDYFRLHPLNNHFAFWINDKITLKNIFSHPIKSISNPNISYNLMPEYYLYIENDGHFSYLMDSPKDIDKDENYIYNLLQLKEKLALKPSNGGGGVWLC